MQNKIGTRLGGIRRTVGTLMTTAVVTAAAAATVTLTAGPATAAPAQTPMGGGTAIVVGGNAACTLTTIGHDGAGRLIGITAGHCGNPGDAVFPEFNWNDTPVGTVVAKYPAIDVEVIEFDPAVVAPVNRVGGVAITGVGSPTEFPDITCKEGRTTGNTCGITWLTDSVNQETWTQICVVEGDSGAPVVAGTTLVGMINAYAEVPCLGPSVGTTMDATLAALNAAGGPGAGFQPI